MLRFTMPISPVALVSAPLLLMPSAVLATQVDRQAVTLGALAQEADRVALVHVSHVSESEILGTIEVDVFGAPDGALVLPRSGELEWSEGSRYLLFLREDEWGTLQPLATTWQRVPLANPRTAKLVLDAVRLRLPQLGVRPGTQQLALFLQLLVTHERVREDAALDLLAYQELEATPIEIGSLAAALRRHPSLSLLDLAARLPHSELFFPLLHAARGADDRASRGAACQALANIDRDAAVRILRADLERIDPKRAARAAHLLGLLGGEAAAHALAGALDDLRPLVRRAATQGLGESEDAEVAIRALEALIWRSEDSDAARRACAALALAYAGEALRAIEKDHPSAELRELAGRLRQDPSELARRILWE